MDFKKDLEDIRALEQKSYPEISKTKHSLGFHLMPPAGWLNDPNGLCEAGGVYHIFFQYSPKNANGAEKYWGHYITQDFIEYTYTGPFMSPDNQLDADGVYSGSAYVEDGKIYIYYTGNVKLKGDYDYTYTGRLSNTILVKTDDGTWTDDKKAVLTNKDYPEGMSCHIRDPKVFKDEEGYKMVLGARTKDDKGCVFIYASSDLVNWSFVKLIESGEPFGYMWECPDIITIAGKSFLSLSPQGVASEEYRYQNIYQSGYFALKDDYEIDESVPFTEWDMGFDFYAPQTFRDEKGRYILIGWMGIPDADYTNEPTVRDGWQHALTMARELTLEGNKVIQKPLAEYEALRDQRIDSLSFKGMAEISVKVLEDKDIRLAINDSLVFCYDSNKKAAALLFDQDKENMEGAVRGFGRTVRKAKVESLEDIKIYLDTSAVEIYVNGGKTVFASRYYCDIPERKIDLTEGLTPEIYSLKQFKINI
ncbi:MAG: glycoside hydrolase family 32 protein [Saccharofermentans sp.]|nr:glycoside hydrolase family 32 protein [Saccharofermentans sp.]